jgi:hypothetical protein
MRADNICLPRNSGSEKPYNFVQRWVSVKRHWLERHNQKKEQAVGPLFQKLVDGIKA